jgi:hypothetical protein
MLCNLLAKRRLIFEKTIVIKLKGLNVDGYKTKRSVARVGKFLILRWKFS